MKQEAPTRKSELDSGYKRGFETDGSDIEGCSGVRIENKNVVFVTDFWNKLNR